MNLPISLSAFLLGTSALAATANAAPLRNGVEAANGSAKIQVTALTDNILRVRIGKGGAFAEDASWAVPAAVRKQGAPVTATADGFQTKSVAVHVNPTTLGLNITDLQGRTIVADGAEPVSFDGK